jgi:O-antigen ligase
MKQPVHPFSGFHLVAAFCVMAAAVSSMVSSFPLVAFSKTARLLLLFFYAGTGARLAIKGQEQRFFGWLMRAIEVTVYISAAAYFGARQAIFGNPNSLGAVMGVVGEPLLLWSVFIADRGSVLRRRRAFALIICLVLLFFSRSRAGILAALLSSLALAVFSRRRRLAFQISVAVLLTAVLAVAVTPSESDNEDIPTKPEDSSLKSFYLYKGRSDGGILGSRRSPWQEATATIKETPWFGTGFGTAANEFGDDVEVGLYSSNTHTVREHGNSFLAILESVGLLGVIPFAALVIMQIVNLGRAWFWLAKTGDIYDYAVPLTLVTTAGLVNACFEDWLFAVGYYLCVLFWIFAFALLDYLPKTAKTAAAQSIPTWSLHPVAGD